ncbi:DUF4148 domain-containing protein [Paraburkholderia sp. SIMBA_054]|uniref:DUF4148 domain-containing protein n=1 Tax=Paraburkholderia sp. SIMBA_054 TaxID=3085795 RepID=UPI00397C1A17
MNRMTIAIVLAGTLMSAATAFAQSAPSNSTANAQPANQVAQVGTSAMSPASTSGGLAGPYGQPVAGKTRAQVYQELVHAEQDGQLAYLNSTVYAHP